MNTSGVILSPQAAQRIADAVKKLENEKPRRPDDRPQFTEQTFWAPLAAPDIFGRAYSWVKVYPDLSSELPDMAVESTRSRCKIATPVAAGIHSAVEANGQRGIQLGGSCS